MIKFFIILVFSFNVYPKAGCNNSRQDFEIRLQSAIKTLKISKAKLKDIGIAINQSKKETAKIEYDIINIKQKILNELVKDNVDSGSIRFLKEELNNNIFISVDKKMALLDKIKSILGPETFVKFQKSHRQRLQKDKKRNNVCE